MGLVAHPVAPHRAEGPGQYLPADEHGCGGVRGDGEDGGGFLRGCAGEVGDEAPGMPREEREPPLPAPGGADPPAEW